MMPNLRGPHESKRRLGTLRYTFVVQSVVMYGSPIWYEALAKNLSVQRPLQKIQRQLAIKIVAGYRTVFYEVTTLLARTPPWILVAKKYQRIYKKIAKTKEDKTWSKEKEEEFKEEEELDMQKCWKKRIKKEDLPGPKLRAAISKRFEEWMSRGHSDMNYHMTQLLTGHGCFNAYLQRIKKIESAMCTYCG